VHPRPTGRPAHRLPGRIQRIHRTLVVLGALLVTGVATAPAAGAHTTSGPPASNYSTQLGGIRPPAPGVTARVDPDGERIVLTVTAPRTTAVVYGYSEEPYLRIGPAGVFENRSSPAVVLNRTRVPTGRAPTGPIRAPRWVRISTGHTARWHDHRTHWMGGATPAPVRRDPDHAHVVGHWRIPLRVDARATGIDGTIRWAPPPAAWPWWLAAAGVAAGVILLARVATRPVALVTLAVLAVGEIVHLWGAWPFSTAGTVGRLGENLPSIATIAVTILTLVWVARRGVGPGSPLLIVTGLFCLVAGGLSDVAALSHSWIPSRIDPALARALIALAVGGGIGLMWIGGTHLRPARPEADRLAT
jgi:hypothetical protein